MGSGPSKKSDVAAGVEFPMYGVSMLGPRHVIVGGGGGSAKTGVKNSLRIFFIKPDGSGDEPVKCGLIPLDSIGTGESATMNLDIFPLSKRPDGDILLACGQDDLCKIYHCSPTIHETIAENGTVTSKTLNYDVKLKFEFKSDKHEKSSYQKVVRFAPRAEAGKEMKFLMATGGADGHFRLWNSAGKMCMESNAHTDEIDDLDISHDGALLLSVGKEKKAYLWNLEDGGKKVGEIPATTGLKGSGVLGSHRVRSARFTRFGRMTTVFLTASVPVQRRGKGQQSFLSLFSFNRRTGNILEHATILACEETISTLALSEDSTLTAIGTLGGSVHVFETGELRPLRSFPNTHGIFVTGLAFFPTQPETPDSAGFLISEDHRGAVMSISADQSVQIHYLPWKKPKSFSAYLMKTFLWLFIIYVILWFIGFY